MANMQMVDIDELRDFIQNPDKFVRQVDYEKLLNDYKHLLKMKDDLGDMLEKTVKGLKNSRTFARTWFILWLICTCSTAILSFLLWGLT